MDEAQTDAPKLSKKTLNIRQKDYSGGIQIWGSNPAFIWTGKNAEEEGIQVGEPHSSSGSSIAGAGIQQAQHRKPFPRCERSAR
jgi:hypothetical protein